MPQLKLVQKLRVGSKYVRKYDKPKTPYQRLLESEHLTMGQKEVLRRKYEFLNPILLRDKLQRKLFEFRQMVRILGEEMFKKAS